MNCTNRMMKSVLLFYKKLLSGLKEMGFKVNPYDPCMANKLVGGANMTIQWHVDDPMIWVMPKGKKFWRSYSNWSVYMGKTLQKTLGRYMTTLEWLLIFWYMTEWKHYTCKYISKIIADFPEEIVGKSAISAMNHLFKIREDGHKLNEKLAKAFHHAVYQLLFAANQVRINIQTAVSFLTTWVQEPDKDDWGKLRKGL